MHDKHLYEYAVVRYVPRVEREEFVNVGLVMMCKRRKWLRIAVSPDFKRIAAFSPIHTAEEISHQLEGLVKVAEGHPDGGIIGSFDVTERFRWLAAVRSACIQTSRPHPGLCDDLEDTFECLFNELVL